MSVSLPRPVRWMTLSVALLLTLALSTTCDCEGAPSLDVQNLLSVPVDVHVVTKWTELDPASGIAQDEWGKPSRRVAAGTDEIVRMLNEDCEATDEGKRLRVYVRALEVGGQGRTYVGKAPDDPTHFSGRRVVLDEAGFR